MLVGAESIPSPLRFSTINVDDFRKTIKMVIDPTKEITSGATHCVIERASNLSSRTKPTCRSKISKNSHFSMKSFPTAARNM